MSSTRKMANAINQMYHRFASPPFSSIVHQTPLQFNEQLSTVYGQNIYFKREDLQPVRSFKIRGAAAAIFSLSEEKKKLGVVCASAGNHAQGVAQVCSSLQIPSDIFIPHNTPLQKQERIEHFNGDNRIHRSGNTIQECLKNAQEYAKCLQKTFIHPYDDNDTIIGQGTLGAEIVNQCAQNGFVPDIIIGCIGGGGLMAGVSTYVSQNVPSCELISAEPDTCPSFQSALDANRPVCVTCTDNFVDGATVQQMGHIPFEICSNRIHQNMVIPVGQLCSDVLEMYDRDGIIVEPAGALSVSALHRLTENEMNQHTSTNGCDTLPNERKNIICIVGGGNNDLSRYPEIIERSQIWKKLKHYYVVSFTQKPGELRRFVTKVLGPTDDISRFEYMQKNNRETGAVLIGITVRNPNDIYEVEKQMKRQCFTFEKVETETEMGHNSLHGTLLL